MRDFDQTSFICYSGKSMAGGAATALANKLSIALFRVISNKPHGNNHMVVGSSDEEEEVNDLLQMIEELNSHSDLTLKLSNQSKICKILELSPVIQVDNTTSDSTPIK
jgi:hypothetical protein